MLCLLIMVTSQGGGSVTAGTTPGAAYWTRSTDGLSAGGYSVAQQIGAITSATAADGSALFDSDFLDNGGQTGAANVGTGTAPSFHEGVLISPRIDLSGVTDSSLQVSFYSQYFDLNIRALTVGISVDNGATFTEVDYQQYQPELENGRVEVPFIDVLKGAANLSSVRLQFKFSGDYFFAKVDDVTLSVLPS